MKVGLAYHLVMARDQQYGERVYPAIRKGAEFIVTDHRTNNAHGLIRSSIPYDAPMLTGHHTCHNLFALLALRTSIRAAQIMGETADAMAWTTAEATYRKAIIDAIGHTYQKEGYIRSGLYDWTAGTVQGNGRTPNRYPNQDWENNLLVYPTELLKPNDPRVAGTLAEIRRRKYREGVMSYRNGMHIHQYVTLNQAQQYRAIGDQHHALRDLYHVLLHNGPTHEGFENLVDPWSTRTPAANCPPPHAWAAAKIALFIRNMMVCESGGQAGMIESERDLHLFSLVSPSWIAPGRKVVIRNAPTEMGPVSATLAFTESGATLNVEGDFRHEPRHIVFRIPNSVEVTSFEDDAETSFRKDGQLFFTPDLTRATIEWTTGAPARNIQKILRSYRSEYDFIVEDGNYDPSRAGKPFLLDDETDIPAEHLSFDLVRRAFLREYGRRFNEFVDNGGSPYRVEPPPLLTQQQRHERFRQEFGDTSDQSDPGIAMGQPVTASKALPRYPAANAVDGNATDLSSSWQTESYPAWLVIDLEEPTRIDRVHLFPYWGAKRYYQYTIDVSADGQSWRQVVDMSGNTTPADPAGTVHRFTSTKARYIRVNMLYHNLNKGVHLVEIRVYGPKAAN